MNFVDYLDFVQVATLCNFGAMYWRRKGNTDFIESLFNDSHYKILFSKYNDFGEFDKRSNEVEIWTGTLIGNKTVETLTESDKEFLKQKHEFRKLNQTIIDSIQINNSKKRSWYFEYICLFLGLYGLFQWFLIPVINNVLLRNIYMFLTEAVIILLFWYLGKEIWLSYHIIQKKVSSSSYWAFVIKFIILLSFSVLWGWGVEKWGLPTCNLICSETNFILVSFLLPYVSYIVYFLLSYYDFCIRTPQEAHKLENNFKRCDELYNNIKSKIQN